MVAGAHAGGERAMKNSALVIVAIIVAVALNLRGERRQGRIILKPTEAA